MFHRQVKIINFLISIFAYLCFLSSCSHVQNLTSEQDLIIFNQKSNFIRKISNNNSNYTNDQVKFLNNQSKAIKNNNWDNLKKESLQYLQQNPYDKIGLSLLALSYYQLNELEFSEYIVNLILNEEYNHLFALNLKGIILYKKAKTLNDFKKSQEIFKSIYKNNPNEIAAGLNLGYLSLNLGDLKSAEITFDSLLEQCGDCTSVETGYAITQMRLGKFETAQVVFEGLIEKNESNLIAKYQLARCYFQDGETEEKGYELLKELVEEKNGPRATEEVIKKAEVLWNLKNNKIAG